VKKRRRKKNVESAGPLDVTPAIRRRIARGLSAAAAPHAALAKEGVKLPKKNPALEAVGPRHGELVSLGLLTKIRTTHGVLSFPLRRAPVLAYHVCGARGGRDKCDVPKKLVIVHRARSSKGVRPTSKEARREYERVHWGDKGTRPSIPGRVFAGGRVRIIGTIRSVVYTTQKGGDADLTDYDHAFEGERPVLGKSDGLFVILGGSYRVEPRGIVG